MFTFILFLSDFRQLKRQKRDNKLNEQTCNNALAWLTSSAVLAVCFIAKKSA